MEGTKMITVFDLRENQEDLLYKTIEKIYEAPVKIIKFDPGSIKACIGCWSCWLKTPGLCVFKDAMSTIYADYMASDTVVLLMDTAQGFINHQAKGFLDRTIPHYHPYIELIDGECHHVARYKAYPDLVFYFDSEDLSEKEEQVIEDYLYRTAYHFKSKAYRMIQHEGFKVFQLESRVAKRGQVSFEAAGAMEKLIIYNGSPRITNSNSGIVLSQALGKLGDKIEVRDLKEVEQWDLWADRFNEDQHVMFFMPLYVHAMPSHVMKFIEKLVPSEGSISFFVQSGFPESSQSYYLEAYFEQLALSLGRKYLGTAIKGGFEGLQMRPQKGQEAMIRPLIKTLEHLIDSGEFDQEDVLKLAKPVRFDMVTRSLFKLLARIGFINAMLWDPKLKANQAYHQRFDQPYVSLGEVMK